MSNKNIITHTLSFLLGGAVVAGALSGGFNAAGNGISKAGTDALNYLNNYCRPVSNPTFPDDPRTVEGINGGPGSDAILVSSGFSPGGTEAAYTFQVGDVQTLYFVRNDDCGKPKFDRSITGPSINIIAFAPHPETGKLTAVIQIEDGTMALVDDNDTFPEKNFEEVESFFK